MTTNPILLCDELTPGEILEAQKSLEETRDAVFSATSGLSEAQWNYSPAGGGWTIAGILEHIVLIQELVLGPIWQALASSDEAPRLNFRAVDAIVRTEFPSRSRKFPAPELVHPNGRWTPPESLERLSGNTMRLKEHLVSTPDLRRHQAASRPLAAMTKGEHTSMDGYQWILAAAAHTDRHTRQILEVKAEPGFPQS